MTSLTFNKFKRFFVFGCSFTSYKWPTWADIIAQEMPDIDYYNFGHCGGGNLLMSIRVTEANMRYRFTEDDLVMVMWTTFCREDRYKNNHWWNTGNIFTASHDYPDDYIRKYSDPMGYLIRDLAVITQTTSYLKSLPATTITMASVPYDYQMEYNDTDAGAVIDLLELYKETTALTPPCLFELEMGRKWENGHAYYDHNHCKPGGLQFDYHPNPNRYRSYLEKIGLPLSDKSLAYAKESTETLHKIGTRVELDLSFPEIKFSKSRTIL